MLKSSRPFLAAIAGALLFASPALSQTPEQISLLTVTATVYPGHGLPAIPPSLKVTITNHGNAAITIPPVQLCMRAQPESGTARDIGCQASGAAVDHPYVPGPPATGAITIAGQRSYTTYIPADQNVFFFAQPLLQPGAYDLSVRLNTGEIWSNAVRYTIDSPQGDDAVVNAAIQQRLSEVDPGDIPYLDEHLSGAFAAKPASSYGKVAVHYADMLNRGPLADFIQRSKSYLASGLPPSFDGLVRVQLALASQQKALDAATRTGQIDETSVQLLDQGRLLLQGVAASQDFVAAAMAGDALQNGVWTRQQLQQWVQDVAPKKMNAIQPHADCVVRNPDRTFTAWFGYDNRNQGIFRYSIGAANGFSPAPADRGQPTVFDIGRKRRVFSVALKAQEKVTWTLNGKTATASADDNEGNCGQDDGED